MNKTTILFLLLTQALFGKFYLINNTNTSGPGSFKSVMDSIHLDKGSSNVAAFSVEGELDITNIDSIKTNVHVIGMDSLFLFRTSGSLHIDNAEVRLVSLNAKNPNDWGIKVSNSKFIDIQSSKLSVDVSINQVDSIHIQNSDLAKLDINKAKTISLSSNFFYGDRASVTIDSIIAGGRVDVLNSIFGHDRSETLIPMSGHALEIKNCPDATVYISSSWFLPATPTSNEVSGSGKGIIIDNFSGYVAVRYNWFGITQNKTGQSKLLGDGVYVDAPQGDLYLYANTFFSVDKESYCIKVINAKDSSIVNQNVFGAQQQYINDQEGRGMYIKNFNNGVISSNTFSGSEGSYSLADENVDYQSGLVLLSSKNNAIYANFFGISNAGPTGILENGNGMNGIWLGSGSTTNNIRTNWISSNKHYGINDVSGGANIIRSNSIACNDSGSFKIGSEPEILDYFNQNLPVLAVDGSGKSISLSMTGMPVVDGSIIYIYKKTDCENNTLTSLYSSFIDSVLVSNGAFSYNFPSEDNLRGVTSTGSNQYYILAAQSNGEAIGSSKPNDVVTHAVNVNGQNFTSYPNPVEDVLHVSLGKGVANAMVSIVDQTGRVVIVQSVGKLAAIDVTGLTSGIYHVRVVGDGGSYSARVFIK